VSQGPAPYRVGRDGHKPLLLKAAEEAKAFHFDATLRPILRRTRFAEPSKGHRVVMAESSGVGMVRSTE
jgi:hypothetical protein